MCHRSLTELDAGVGEETIRLMADGKSVLIAQSGSSPTLFWRRESMDYGAMKCVARCTMALTIAYLPCVSAWRVVHMDAFLCQSCSRPSLVRYVRWAGSDTFYICEHCGTEHALQRVDAPREEPANFDVGKPPRAPALDKPTLPRS